MEASRAYSAHSQPASAADQAVAEILEQISVPEPVLGDARNRRGVVLGAAMEHQAARDPWASGSVAHGTTNRPLEDADGGVKVRRTLEHFRDFGPDAGDDGKGPEEFFQMFAAFVLPRVRRDGYPQAGLDLNGNRAIKVLLNRVVEIDEWGPVDPYVDLIVGLTRKAGGLWIPNRELSRWDVGDPEYHTWLLTERDPKSLRVLRAHVIRLAKRAVKRDAVIDGRMQVMSSWNLTALAVELITEEQPLAVSLANFFHGAATSIKRGLTEDPSPAIEEPISLPDDVDQNMASARLAEMGAAVQAALGQRSKQAARQELKAIYGEEIDSILESERHATRRSISTGDKAALSTLLGVPREKSSRSHGRR